MLDKLDSNNGVPLYRQLVDAVRESILSGEFPQNSKIPTETELSERYAISRITVRNAIEELAEEGLLIKRQGKGTYVAPDKLERNMRTFMGFSESCEAAGRKPSAKLLSIEIKPSSSKQSQLLQIQPETNVIHLKRIRFIDGLPVMIEENIFPIEYSFLFHNSLAGSLYALLREHGVNPVHGRRTISICYAKEEEAALLDTDVDTALLLMDDVVIDHLGKTIHIAKQVIRSDRYQLVIDT